ncbi:uncharacterized protein SPSC_00606 [Sporisorium scitamineum]|uniref:Uncharacterized protein n=1 Tax=Sporisorium scitamineum TaxID=49012 RepID=A0A127Z7C1_9BASI|nr:uncharacterized protein SPSC_00606 [Sporisorium scitamineum]
MSASNDKASVAVAKATEPSDAPTAAAAAAASSTPTASATSTNPSDNKDGASCNIELHREILQSLPELYERSSSRAWVARRDWDEENLPDKHDMSSDMEDAIEIHELIKRDLRPCQEMRPGTRDD